jgi:hypothetical protein
VRRTSFSDHGVGWTRSHQLPPVRTSTRTYLRKTRDADQRFLSSHPPGQAEGALRPSRSFYNAEYLLLRAILRTPDVESYFMQCQGGDQGGEPVRDTAVTAPAPGRTRRCCADRLAAISPAEATGSDPAPGQRPTFRVVRCLCLCRPRCYDDLNSQLHVARVLRYRARTHTARRPQAEENP